MINDLVKHEVIRLKDALDNYQRGTYSRSVAEQLIRDAAKTILSTIQEKSPKEDVYSVKRVGKPTGSSGKPYSR